MAINDAAAVGTSGARSRGPRRRSHAALPCTATSDVRGGPDVDGTADSALPVLLPGVGAPGRARPTLTSLRPAVLAVLHEVTQLLGSRPGRRLAGPPGTAVDADLVEDVTAVVRTSLAAAGLPAPGRRRSVLVEADDHELRVVVADQGCGVRQDGRDSGLAELGERALRRGGGMTTERPDEGGLHVCWTVPLP